MFFCKHCGREAEEADIFCRKCGTKLAKTKATPDEYTVILDELTGLVEDVTKNIRSELISQVSEIEEGIKKNGWTKQRFYAEVEEIRSRLNDFVHD
ncbi:MAG TPA: zinc ribbon domain-containing protein [Euryarchaeota archaeon]|nr:hypothetical protein BMS3Bbin16_01204 [archaeon BMS3Bbin16]HDH28335.1 zinc ribbon domain-containing protein [Euryarchaeota archaeon]